MMSPDAAKVVLVTGIMRGHRFGDVSDLSIKHNMFHCLDCQANFAGWVGRGYRWADCPYNTRSGDTS